MLKTLGRARSQQVNRSSAVNPNILKLASDGDYHSKSNPRRRSNSNHLGRDSAKLLNADSSVSKELSSDWWKNLSDMDKITFPNIENKNMKKANRNEENSMESSGSEIVISVGKKSFFASQEQKNRKSRYSEAFNLGEVSKVQPSKEDKFVESPPNIITKQSKKKRKKKSIFPIVREKRKYSDVFTVDNQVREAQANKDEVMEEDLTGEELQDNARHSLFAIKRNSKRFTEAFFDESAEKVSQISKDHVTQDGESKNDTNEGSLDTGKETLFKVNRARKKYSEAFFEDSVEKNENPTQKRISGKKSRENDENESKNDTNEESLDKEKETLFKVNRARKKYSEAFFEESVGKNENPTQKRNSGKKSRENDENESKNDTNEESLDKGKETLFKVNRARKKYSEAFFKESVGKNENPTQKRNSRKKSRENDENESKNDTNEESLDKGKETLFKVNRERKKYSEAFFEESVEQNENQGRNSTINEQSDNNENQTFKLPPEKRKNSGDFATEPVEEENQQIQNKNSISQRSESRESIVENSTSTNTSNIKSDEIPKTELIVVLKDLNLLNVKNNSSTSLKNKILSNDKTHKEVNIKLKQSQNNISNISNKSLRKRSTLPKSQDLQSDIEVILEESPQKNSLNISLKESKGSSSKKIEKTPNKEVNITKRSLRSSTPKNNKISRNLILIETDSELSNEEYNIEEIITQKETVDTENKNLNSTSRSTRNMERSRRKLLLDNDKNKEVDETELEIPLEKSVERSKRNTRSRNYSEVFLENSKISEAENNKEISKSDNVLSHIKIGKDSRLSTNMPVEDYNKTSSTKPLSKQQSFLELVENENQPVEDEINVENMDVNNDKTEGEKNSTKYSDISSLNISDEIKHPLFFPKARKSLKSNRSSSAGSAVSKYFEGSLISSTKLLINTNLEKSSEDESAKNVKSKSTTSNPGDKNKNESTESQTRRKSRTSQRKSRNSQLLTVHEHFDDQNENNTSNTQVKDKNLNQVSNTPEKKISDNEENEISNKQATRNKSLQKGISTQIHDENVKEDNISQRISLEKSVSDNKGNEISDKQPVQRKKTLKESSRISADVENNEDLISEENNTVHCEGKEKHLSNVNDISKSKVSISRKSKNDLEGYNIEENENAHPKILSTDQNKEKNDEDIVKSKSSIFKNSRGTISKPSDDSPSGAQLPGSQIFEESRNLETEALDKDRYSSLRPSNSILTKSKQSKLSEIFKVLENKSNIDNQIEQNKSPRTSKFFKSNINNEVEQNKSPRASKFLTPISESTQNRPSTKSNTVSQYGSSISRIIEINSTIGTRGSLNLRKTFEPIKRNQLFNDNRISVQYDERKRLQILMKAAESIAAEKPKKIVLPVRNTKITNFFQKINKKEIPKPKVQKTNKVQKKSQITARLINGKPYHPKKLYREVQWSTPKFYKFLQNKIRNEFDDDTINESEKLMKYIVGSVKTVRKAKKYIKEEVDNLKKELARYGIISTDYEFFGFCFDYLPAEYRDLVVPRSQAFTSEPTVPYDQKNIFKQIKY